MDWILYLKAVILGIVEGLTEFLPVSSTGHLIVFGSLLDYTGQEADTFYIAIQAGAIVAVCWYYRERILKICKGLFTEPTQQKLAWNTIIAFLPAAVIGVMVAKYIKEWLFNPVSVAAALVIGGIIILIVERYQDKKSRHHGRYVLERRVEGRFPSMSRNDSRNQPFRSNYHRRSRYRFIKNGSNRVFFLSGYSNYFRCDGL